jgi:SAM-dependent methyltransferase
MTPQDGATDAAQATEARAEPIDFDAIYRGESPLRERLGTVTPWDIGQPQPFLVELVRSGQIESPVLDAGCGLGDNAFFLAGEGHAVTGFDLSPTAIARARERAVERGDEVAFVVADATSLEGFDGRFRTIVDSALYHCLSRDQRRAYAAAAHRTLQPGGRIHVVCFADTKVKRLAALHYIAEAELRDVFSGGWRITRLELTGLLTAFTLEHLARAAAADGTDDVDGYVRATFDVDDEGRVFSPCWLLTAERC